MLRRHEISGAASASLHAQAMYCALAPMLCGKAGLPTYLGFLERMNAIICNAEPETPNPESSAFDAVASRAAEKPIAAILDNPETQRRLAAINRGDRP